MGKMWNLWYGCKKYSDGCKHCYVYRSDAKYGRDASKVIKTKQFGLPIEKKKNGEYICPSGTMFWTCFRSDFLIDECDEWRIDAWKMIKERSDCHFLFIIKRIERFNVSLPDDWGDGYENVTVCVTCENQETADYRLPIFKSLPIKHKIIIHEPLISSINIKQYVDSTIQEVVVGGESGYYARECNFEWVLAIREQCVEENVSFTFKQTGTNFIKDGRRFKVDRKMQHSQARKAGINYKNIGEYTK